MASKGKFKAVLFDLGGTLVKTVEVPKIFRRILAVYHVKVSYDDVLEVHEMNKREFDEEKMAKMGKEYWVKWNSRILERLGIQDNNQFLARKIDEVWWKYAELEAYPDVAQTLAQLRIMGIKTGVVTNGLERDFKQILQKLDLTDYFDVVVGVDACKKAKPDRAIFLCAINRLNVLPKEAIFVGDSIKHDYEGARKAGLKSLIINRERKVLTDVEAITQLTEVLSYF